MLKFSYTAKTQKGESRSGIQEARDKYELARILRQQGLVLIAAVQDDIGKRKLELTLPFLDRVSLKEKMMFARNLRVMISAGLSLPVSLKTLAAQSKNKKLKKALDEITEEIIKGESFSDSLIKHPDIFSELFCNMIKVGEESGTMEENLGILTGQMEKEYALKAKIKGAMVYPAVIVTAMIGIGVLMLVMVVPKLAATFEELGIELPLTTRIIIALAAFLITQWYLVILIFIIFIVSARIILKTAAGKKTIDGLVLKIPVISLIVKQTQSAYLTRTLGSLLASGVTLVRSLEIVLGTLGNFYFKESIAKATKRVKKGEKLSQSLKSYQNLYPLTVIQMLEIGEDTGQTSDILQKLAGFFEEEVTNATQNLSAVIEPVLMLLVGAAVGFFAISMIQPMYGMLGAV